MSKQRDSMPIIYIYLTFVRKEMLIWRRFCTVGSKVHFKFTAKKNTCKNEIINRKIKFVQRGLKILQKHPQAINYQSFADDEVK